VFDKIVFDKNQVLPPARSNRDGYASRACLWWPAQCLVCRCAARPVSRGCCAYLRLTECNIG